jgi:hypothetical protein
MNDKDAAVGPWAAKSAKALLAQVSFSYTRFQ